MIQKQSCRNLLALIILTLFIFKTAINAQFILDTTAVSSGILWKQSPLMQSPPKAGDTLDFVQSWQGIKSLMNSRLNHDGLGILEKRKLAMVNDLPTNSIVMFPTALRYQFIDGLLEYFDSIQGSFYVPEEFVDSVYKTALTILVPMNVDMIRNREVNFVTTEGSIWTNMEGSWEVDFDDGMGWRALILGTSMVVHYETDYSDRNIRFRYTSEDKIYETTTLLKGNSAMGCDLLPHSPPWMSNPELPWRIDTDNMGQTVSGNAYTLWSEDGVFDRPFLFVEGIDFNLQQWSGQIGDFGWCQFMGNDEVNYPMLAQSSELVHALRERGYDLILLDFVDGAADIVSNAALVKKLIGLCNIYKSGDFPLIVAGASMGGQVARVALTEMERDGQDHCAGIYISWDSPHQGAHIPLSIQTAIDFLSSFSAEAEAFKTGALMRPASQQMLINQYHDTQGQVLNPSKFIDFQNYLTELGMPKKTINWAIANGSGIGTTLEEVLWTPLLETSCNATALFAGDEFRMWLYAAPGNPDHALSTADMYVIADLIYSETYSSLLSFVYTEYSGVYSISHLAPQMDFNPGGYRTSVKELVDVVNGNSDYLSVCSEITSDQYALKHSFISPQSAMCFQGNNNIGLIDALIADPLSTPFDAWYVPSGDNQPHVAMTPQNIQWLLQQIDAVNYLTQCSDEYACSPFIYGLLEDNYLFPAYLQGTQEVGLNNVGPLHCGQAQGIQPATLKMRLLNQCGHLGFVLKDKSVLKVGEADGSLKCQLTLSPGATIVLHDKSKLILGLGSKIIVGPNSRMVIEDFSSVINLGGEIVVFGGGEIIYNGMALSLEHNEAKLLLDEGKLTILEGKTLNLQPSPFSSGALVVRNKNFPAIQFEPQSMLLLQGESIEDDVIIVDTLACLFSQGDGQGAIHIMNGAVKFEKDSRWLSQASIRLEKVKLYSNGAYENQEEDVVFENNKVIVQGSIWHHISLSGYQSHLRATESRWLGNEMNNWVKGSLTITQSDMMGSGWNCKWIGLPFSFRNVSFSGNGNECGLTVNGAQNAPLVVEGCDFSDYQIGIKQSDGVLKVSCSGFSQLLDALVLNSGSLLRMNEESGRNSFFGNERHIVLNEVCSPSLLNGGNQFGDAGQYAIYGLVILPAGASGLNWSGNEWTNDNIYVESYFTSDPNNLLVNDYELQPALTFASCHEASSNYKTIAEPPSEMLSVAGNNEVSIYDLSGRCLAKEISAAEWDILFQGMKFSSGIYLMESIERGQRKVFKVYTP